MEAGIARLDGSDLRHECVPASSPQAAVRLRAVDAPCWPASVRSPAMLPSDLGLLRHLEGVVDFNAEVAHCTFQLGMPEQ